MAVHSVPQNRLDIISKGLEPETKSKADEFCEVKSGATGTSGEFTNIPTEALGPDLGNRGLGESEKATPTDMELGTEVYSTSHNVGAKKVSDKTLIQTDGIDMDIVEKALRSTQLDANHLTDLDLYDHITNGNFVQKENPSGALTDESNSAIEWLDSIFGAVPGADQMIVGYEARKTLQRHQDIVDRLTGGPGLTKANPDELRDFLMSQYGEDGLEEVHFLSPLEFTDASGSTIIRPMSEEVYVGYKRDLIMIDPDHQMNRRASEDRQELASSTIYKYDRRAAFLTPNAKLHAYGNIVNPS